MSAAWLRRIVVLAIVLLVLHAVGTWAYAIFGAAGAILSALLVAVISVFSARVAGSGHRNNAWFVVPTLIFTALPLTARLWTLVHIDQDWWTRSVQLAPFLAGFAAPVLLLMIVYLGLARAHPATA